MEEDVKMNGNKAQILGVSINSSSASELLNTIVDQACRNVIAKPSIVEAEAIPNMRRRNAQGIASSHAPRNDSLIVFTPNPEFVVEAQKDSEFKQLLNKADINLPDGIGLVWAAWILGEPIIARVSGADVVRELLEYGNGLWDVGCESGCEGGGEVKKWTVGVAGARRGSRDEADILVKRLAEKYPNIRFVNLDDSELSIINYQLSNNIQNSKLKKELKIENCPLNIVLACHGMKKQEQWIMENKDKLNANVFMGVGGSLDFLAGFSKRAPKIMRVVGMEWLWRGLQKPRHFLRIWKAVFVFNWLIGREIMKKRLLYRRRD